VGPAETTEKIELMVGRDLQYIRLNGTIVGALAGLVIFAVAHAVLAETVLGDGRPVNARAAGRDPAVA
jgi:hypothetical protein